MEANQARYASPTAAPKGKTTSQSGVIRGRSKRKLVEVVITLAQSIQTAAPTKATSAARGAVKRSTTASTTPGHATVRSAAAMP